MRALILIGTACLALAACGDPAPDQNNLIEIGNDATEALPPNDNWTPVNTDEANQQAPCPEDKRCNDAPTGPDIG